MTLSAAAAPELEPRGWARGWVLAVVVAVIVLAMFWPAWSPWPSSRHALRWDALWEYWGDLQIQLRASREGGWPLWQGSERLGYPFYADPQAGTLYPGQWLLVGAARALGEVPYWLIVVKNLFHIWLLGFGMAMWLRGHRLVPAACVLGAVAVITSYTVVVNAPSALNWSFAYAPWVLLASERVLARPSARAAAWLGVVMALMILAGALASVWYVALLATPYLHWRSWGEVARRGWPYARAVAMAVVAALVLAAVLAGTQVWATWDVVPQTERAIRDTDFFGKSGWGPEALGNLWSPWAAGIPVYVGWSLLLLAIAALWRGAGAGRFIWAGVWLVGVVCALGEGTPVLRWLAAVLPPIELFRMTHRYLYVASFALAVLAAFGLHEVVLWLRAHCDGQPWLRRWARALAVMVLVVASAEQFAARQAAMWSTMAPLPVHTRDSEAGAMLAEVAASGARWYDRGWLGYRPGARLGVLDVGGYEDDPLALLRYARVRNELRRDPSLCGLVGVAYLGIGEETRRAWPKVPAREVAREVLPGLYAFAQVAPDAWWASGADVVPDAATALARYLKANGAQAFVESAHASSLGDAAHVSASREARALVHAQVRSRRDDALDYAVSAPAPGLLVMNEMYVERGWRATVNGAPAAIAAVNGYARGVAVPAGEVVVSLRFDVPWYRYGAGVAVAAWLALLGAMLAAMLAAWVGRRR